jgi:hypothetical protein
VLAAFTVGTIVVVGSFFWSPSPADAQLDLCELLGDPYCPPGEPGGGAVTCTGAATIGGSGTCTLSDVAVGDEVTATLTCGDFSAVVFQGTVTEVPFSFDFAVPSSAPTASGSIEVAGATFPFQCVSASLARTGGDVGPLVGIAGALLVLGFASYLSARHRLRSQPVG